MKIQFSQYISYPFKLESKVNILSTAVCILNFWNFLFSKIRSSCLPHQICKQIKIRLLERPEISELKELNLMQFYHKHAFQFIFTGKRRSIHKDPKAIESSKAIFNHFCRRIITIISK